MVSQQSSTHCLVLPALQLYTSQLQICILVWHNITKAASCTYSSEMHKTGQTYLAVFVDREKQ